MNTVLIGERYRKFLETHLKNQGFNTIWIPDNPNIDHRLAGHCDLSVFKYEKTIILSQHLENDAVVNYLTQRGYEVKISSFKQGKLYPDDVNLCAALVGDRLLHNPKLTDKYILKLSQDPISVKQGYCRCMCLVLNNKSLITSDAGIANTLISCGYDVLLINNGKISLPGFNYGFIGGAAFVNSDTVYFTGDIMKHPDGKKICDFIHSRVMKIVCLTSNELIDIGGAIVI